ncbi:MAG: prephenate dehydratase [Desulfobacterales bacterium]|jgi:chorismate mutase/prephenate dehydratase|nr:prephenate dehydratase [Desulfobacterales bacterium]
MMSEDNSTEASSRAGSPGEADIHSLRERIDAIDEKILFLINERLNLAKGIGELKGRRNRQVLDSARESEIINRLFKLNEGPIPNKALQLIFAEIFGTSREIQQPQIVSYLGPEATYTHLAARRFFGRAATFMPRASIRDVFEAVEKEQCHFGVVPVENSIEGAVNYTLDLFYESELKICAEKYLTISHDLLSAAGSLEKVTVIYSHPQALAQCRKWLQKYLPGVTMQECRSTAEAAQKALSEKGAAAIASSEAAQLYNLQVMASKIEDFSRNITRFLLIGKTGARPTGKDKTSLMFVTAHAPGALYKALTPIAEAGLNMVKLESRPSPHENWSYCFFLDVEGHMESAEVKETVDIMRNHCLFMKYLGSYPQAPAEKD